MSRESCVQQATDAAERPPWIEEAADPTYWDLAFGSYGDGYLEWVASRYYWEVDDVRSTADTRSLWDKRARYAVETPIVDSSDGLIMLSDVARRPRMLDNHLLNEPPPASFGVTGGDRGQVRHGPAGRAGLER